MIAGHIINFDSAQSIPSNGHVIDSPIKMLGTKDYDLSLERLICPISSNGTPNDVPDIISAWHLGSQNSTDFIYD